MTTANLTATLEWCRMLRTVLSEGQLCLPRGKLTTEILHHTMTVDMRAPVVNAPTRKLSHKFLGAEAYWILSGDDTVAGIAPFNRNISQFSDDGVTFFGAYGPKFKSQVDYVVAKLLADPDSRQAGLTFWRENPPETKDVPCTIAMFFSIRNGRLNSHVFMRSSDAWLGVPYDVFNFTMMALLVCCRLNQRRLMSQAGDGELRPGVLHLTAASRHLYEPNWEAAETVLATDPWCPAVTPMPASMWLEEDFLMRTLKDVRDGRTSPLRWAP